MSKPVRVTMEFESDTQAWLLAMWLKRVGWQEIRGNAQDDDEAYLMREAIERAQKELADAGFAPR